MYWPNSHVNEWSSMGQGWRPCVGPTPWPLSCQSWSGHRQQNEPTLGPKVAPSLKETSQSLGRNYMAPFYAVWFLLTELTYANANLPFLLTDPQLAPLSNGSRVLIHILTALITLQPTISSSPTLQQRDVAEGTWPGDPLVSYISHHPEAAGLTEGQNYLLEKQLSRQLGCSASCRTLYTC